MAHSLTQYRAAVALAVVCFSTRAAAEQEESAPAPVPRERVRIEYRAPAECPDVDVFKGLVSRRVLEDWEAAPGEFARRLVVVIVASESGDYSGTVELADEAGARGAKTVSGADCANVVDGVALATALAIEPRELEEPEPSAAAPPTSPAAETPEETASAAAVPPPPAARAEAPPAPRSAPPAAAADRWKLSGVRLSARALLATGVGPTPALGAGLGMVIETRQARLGVALQGWQTGRTQVREVRARFERLNARLEGCPLVLALSSWASVEPCPFVELGVITGEAFEDPPRVVRGSRGSAPWYAAGGLGRVVARFGKVAVELEGAAGAPFGRERFYLEKGDEVHRVPAYYGAFSAGIGVVF